MPITAWDSESMAWDALSMPTPWPYLEAMRLAIVERYQGANISVPTLLATPFQKLYSLYNYCHAIDLAITQLIPLYVNHADHSGNWNGKTTIPMWTEETILADIGDTARYLSSRLNEMTKKWIRQQYDILNLLRWSKREEEIDTQKGLINEQYFWNASSLASYGSASSLYGTNLHGTGGISVIAFTTYNPYDHPLEYLVNLRDMVDGGWLTGAYPDMKISNNTPFDVACDSYYRTIAIPDCKYIYYNAYGVSDGKIFIHASFDLSSEAENIRELKIPFPEYSLMQFPQFPVYFYIGLIISPYFDVFKFDGPNGFKFRGDDW